MLVIDRRTFLRGAAAGVAGVGVLASSADRLCGSPLGLPIGLALYTVRDLMSKDLDGTLEQVARIGYKEVELYSFFDKPAASLRQSLASAGLACPSGMYPAADLTSGIPEKIDYLKELGIRYLVCPFPSTRSLTERRSSTPAESLKIVNAMSVDDYKWLADLFNHVGEQTHKAGIQFSYHAHDVEFRALDDGKTAFDHLLGSTDPNLVKFELDCYWVTRAGQDPLAYLHRFPGRFPLLHIKDMKAGQTPTTDVKQGGNAFVEVGRGVIDWKSIFGAARQAGVKHYFVEQDKSEHPSLESARISYEYLRNLKT